MKNMEIEISIKFDEIKKKFFQRYLDTIYFLEISRSLEIYYAKSFEYYEKLPKELCDLLSKMDNKYKKFSNDITKHGKIVTEKAYIDMYSSFEEYINDSFKLLIETFPNLLNKQNLNYITIKDVLAIDDYKIFKKNIIEKKVKEIVQTNNIIELLDKYKSMFGIKLELNKDLLSQCFIMSQNRNIFVHNKGIVNNIYIHNLNKQGIKSKYKVGDNIMTQFTTIKDALEKFRVFDGIVDIIDKSISKNIKRLLMHNKSIEIKI